ncbi:MULTISPECIES: tRNA pseudouridine(13) synthase TruD [unclassified Colwellia]|uniref:tRNA pseudouridine(13) synthase TruD n=1 Tax=unclassified Colwellia TaxID=196834 RepID=UPI0015F3E57B|nr:MULTISPECIES: tRNA pseudouridine(13) synthase TruD [unclassified Colwellia]MBA6232442.1 tRNA pseudouridine(13) synthase TruD [Colwellia sp. MB02u-7]MBA6238299.1 tRNA pseudouridine(13) synthase TruD [Colwellia sp. MB02u-11]MBA6254549.1 tRNA pseudouridine(13) synthase TruD [Colwellia sp. MB3u-28]MBA6258280.1 tRNA pseudouridine(13) synthase TruD [Colwellia sp. MB3u-41]MBA6301049.1 tRNA pseudouridine(13) synthase TruD [Colwellia sp. MB3u-22]
MSQSLQYLYTQPESTGQLRSEMSDFKVFERLPFEPCGEGEHLFIHIRKTGANTLVVARELAKYFKVKEGLVSYAGLKDRFAVTEQWFGIHLPGKTVYDLSNLAIEGVEVLSVKRHNKKLRIGALSGNRFELVLRKVSNIDDVLRRWAAVSQFGVPNYFGEQRFGINGGNLDRALELFQGKKVKDKKKRGLYLSAARSEIFNQIISQRIENNQFESLSIGDVFMLSGTQSVFLAEAIDKTIMQRFQEKDIDLTAALWGAGELMSQGESQQLEQEIANEYSDFCQGLVKFGLKQERRRIRLSLTEGQITAENDTITLSFFLPSGCYATTILRELINYQDMTERVGN